MEKIFLLKDKNKKLERKEDRIKQDRIKRLLAMSLKFPTKLDDEASVLGFYATSSTCNPFFLAQKTMTF